MSEGPASDNDLSADRLRHLSGEQNLQRILQVEIIYERVTTLIGLRQCPNLRELCLIDTPGFDRIPDLSFCRNLARITITNQRISSLSAGGGLGSLPQLRELYLQNNSIVSIDGLTGCLGLQKFVVVIIQQSSRFGRDRSIGRFARALDTAG